MRCHVGKPEHRHGRSQHDDADTYPLAALKEVPQPAVGARQIPHRRLKIDALTVRIFLLEISGLPALEGGLEPVQEQDSE